MALSISLRMQHAGKIQDNKYYSEKREVEKPKTGLSHASGGCCYKLKNPLSSTVDLFSRLYIQLYRIMHHITCCTP